MLLGSPHRWYYYENALMLCHSQTTMYSLCLTNNAKVSIKVSVPVYTVSTVNHKIYTILALTQDITDSVG